MNFKRFSTSDNQWHDTPYYIHNTSTDTITTLPADIYANDTTATVDLKGNMEQSDTPTPTTPIQPQECGNKTVNLLNTVGAQSGYIESNGNITQGHVNLYYTDFISIPVGTEFVTQSYGPKGTGMYSPSLCFYDDSKTYIAGEDFNNSVNKTFEVPQNAKYLRTCYRTTMEWCMLNVGSTPLPYEPYGYKIPISSASTTTSVYLGEVQTTRKVKKLVIDGTENWNEGTPNYYIFINVSGRGDGIPNSTALSTHTESGVVVNNNGTALFFKKSVFVHSSLADFKTYLAQQYAAGTPVTVWYVLATEETAVVNEPIRKIGDYADTVSDITIPTISGKDTFDVETTLKPSEVDLTYHGWHPVADVHERESGAWD